MDSKPERKEDDVPVVSSSPSTLRKFIESSVWNDMTVELEKWMEDLQGMYDGCESMVDVAKVQARREAIVYLIGLPHTLLAVAEEKQKKELEARHEKA